MVKYWSAVRGLAPGGARLDDRAFTPPVNFLPRPFPNDCEVIGVARGAAAATGGSVTYLTKSDVGKCANPA
jgi:hypothetical protein